MFLCNYLITKVQKSMKEVKRILELDSFWLTFMLFLPLMLTDFLHDGILKC